MDEIIETRLLEQDDWPSAFLIDLKRHAPSGKHYREITQVILETNERQTLKVNPEVLPHLQSSLSELQDLMPTRPKRPRNYLSEVRQKAIEKKYLSGLTVQDIAWQEGLKVSKVEQVLYNFGHTLLVKNGFKPPIKRYRYRKKKK